jgi:hypothetical protein
MGRKARALAERKQAREHAQRRDAKRKAEAAPRPAVPAKKSRANAEDGARPEITARDVPQPTPIKLVLGERPSEDRDPEALTWICDNCHTVNHPRRCLIADIPVLQCQCGREVICRLTQGVDVLSKPKLT